jgi:transcriptional regulator NrdR family protein
MIACPKCGDDSVVVETRGNRRRRACRDVACNAKFTTVELVTTDGDRADHVTVALHRDVAAALRDVLTRGGS